VIGLDYRGETVLAAHEPVPALNAGIVAKIDLAEVRVPFIKAALLSASLALALIAAGAGLFLRITNPCCATSTRRSPTGANPPRGEDPPRNPAHLLLLQEDSERSRVLGPGDVYVQAHTEADFSHGICPACINEHFRRSRMPMAQRSETASPERRESPRRSWCFCATALHATLIVILNGLIAFALLSGLGEHPT